MQKIRKIVAKEFQAVNQLIVSQLESDVPLVENIGHYIVDAGGKRLRPLLVLLTAACCQYRGREHIKLAAVIEFIHTATLLHDDVVDISSLRRGRPTANAAWGNAPSVLVGDFLYSRAFQLMVDLGDMKIMSNLSDTTNVIAAGEVLQLSRAGDASTSERDYLDIIQRKTAILFASACKAAGQLSKQNTTICTALEQYGQKLGLAFQLVDDALDYEGNSETMGKNIGDDLTEGKPTLPLIYTLIHGNNEQKQIVEHAISEKTAENINQVIAAVSNCGALSYTHELAEQYSKEAKAALELLPSNQYRQAMMELAVLAINRDH